MVRRLVPSSIILASLVAGSPPPLEGQDTELRSIALPPLNAPAVGVHTSVLVDSARHVTAIGGRSIRRPILVRVWYPARPGPRPSRRYMSAEVAEAWRETLPAPAGWEAMVATHAADDAPPAEGPGWPVLLFSHGRSWPAESYQILLEQLASRGWAVVAISHPGEEALTLLPGGTRVPFAGPSWENEDDRGEVLTSVVDDLVLDARLVIDWLEELERHDVRDGHPLRGRLDLSRGVGYAGHSLGGAAAAWTLARDDRVVAAASWEGQVYRPADRPLSPGKPLLYIVGGANKSELAGRHFRGATGAPVQEVVIHGAWHASIGDLLYVYRAYAPVEWRARHRRELTAERVNQITVDYWNAFFGLHVAGRSEADLLEPDGEEEPYREWNYPEVELRTNLGGTGWWTAGRHDTTAGT